MASNWTRSRLLGEGATMPVEPSDELERALASAVEAARAEHPSIAIDDGTFLRHLGAHLPEKAAPEQAIPSMRSADLFLAAGALAADSAALSSFDRLLRSSVGKALTRQGAPPDAIDEVTQLVRNRLLVATGRRPPLADYAGRGSLSGWVRATAVRTYLNSLRGIRERPADDEQIFERVADESDPELSHLRGLYRDQFKQAFYQAVEHLDDQDKLLLRYFYVDGLNLDDIAKLQGFSRATAHRRLVRARALVAEATEGHLKQNLGLADTDFQSVRRLVLSDLHITLERMLNVAE